MLLDRLAQTWTALGATPSRLAKRRLIEGWIDRHGADWSDSRVAALALQYHDLRPERSLASRVGLERITTDDEVVRAVTEPPTDTRAYFRGRCLAKFASSIVAANWDSIVFDVGREPLRRVPMMEPLRGTADHVARLIDESDSAVELLDRLGS